MSRSSGTRPPAATYVVRGLTCPNCLVNAIEKVRSLPGVDAVRVDLVPYGESLLTVAPAAAVSGEQMDRALRPVGFEVMSRRPRPVSLNS